MMARLRSRQSIHLVSSIVCTGKTTATEAEFNALASTLGLANNVGLSLICMVNNLFMLSLNIVTGSSRRDPCYRLNDIRVIGVDPSHYIVSLTVTSGLLVPYTTITSSALLVFPGYKVKARSSYPPIN